jgi:ABC-type branched-subunit amino acid transport system ATPase component
MFMPELPTQAFIETGSGVLIGVMEGRMVFPTLTVDLSVRVGAISEFDGEEEKDRHSTVATMHAIIPTRNCFAENPFFTVPTFH